MKKKMVLVMVGLLILSMTACGGGGATDGGGAGQGEKAVEEVKSEDLLKDSKGFGESPELQEAGNRFAMEPTAIEVDGKTYKNQAIYFEAPIYGNYADAILTGGTEFYILIKEGDPATVTEDGLYKFTRKGNVLAEQTKINTGAVGASWLESFSLDNQGNVYCVDGRDVVKLGPQGFLQALQMGANGAFVVSPDGKSGLVEYLTSGKELNIGSDGKITMEDVETPLDSIGLKVEIVDGKFTGEHTVMEDYLKEGRNTTEKLFRTQKHYYSQMKDKDENLMVVQMDLEGKETLAIKAQKGDEFRRMGQVKGVAELDGKIFLFGEGMLVFDEAGNFLKYVIMDQYSAKSDLNDGSYLLMMSDEEGGYRPSYSFDSVVQAPDGRIYGLLVMEKMQEMEEMEDEELVVVELLTYSGDAE